MKTFCIYIEFDETAQIESVTDHVVSTLERVIEDIQFGGVKGAVGALLPPDEDGTETGEVIIK